MLLATRDYMNSNDALLRVLPQFPILFGRLNQVITLIHALGEEQAYNRKGVTLNKKSLRRNLNYLTADTSRRIKAHATLENNLVLLHETKYTDSDFKRCSDTRIRGVAQGVHNRAQMHLDALAEFGVTTEKLQALQDAIDAYLLVTPRTRMKIAASKQNNDKTVELFKEADMLLKKIDLLVEMQKNDFPDLYTGYRGVRKVVNTSPTRLVFKGKVVNAETGEPIRGAKVVFMMESGDRTTKLARKPEAIVKHSAYKGGITDKSMSTGLYDVAVLKNGFALWEGKLFITEGERTEMVFRLNKL